MVLFTHADPFAWDVRGGPSLRQRYYQLSPPEPDGTRSSTEDIQHFTRLTRIIAAGLFTDGGKEIAQVPGRPGGGAACAQARFFDADGNRRSGTGEHVVVLASR